MVKGRQSMQDKLLEVVGVDGALQLGASQVGLYTATQLAQASSVKIINKVTLPMEVDGEPSWLTKDGVIEITHKSQAYVLARCKKRSSHAVATNVIDWAAQKNIITAEQRNLIQHEIAHRAGDLDPARKTGSWARLHTGDDCEKKDTVSIEEAISTMSARYRSGRDLKSGLEGLTRRSQRRWIEAEGDYCDDVTVIFLAPAKS
ncbi:unnamed protein product [Effrenium voratum]|uniref:Diacylglycerol kinase accessory domain-containing protein n=1 Tax=Effrenium voratum TaxID=2562239 RepID=A0AA36HNK9_9DINO|nr:unnamed protein product [Effrenium voratum]